MFVFGIAAAAAATWAASPFIAMSRRGTLAQQQHEAIRAEVRRLQAARALQVQAETPAPAPSADVVVIPSPRSSSEPVTTTANTTEVAAS